MREAVLSLAILLTSAFPVRTWGQSDRPTSVSGMASDSTPLYGVSFERRDAVPGISASPAIELPFECSSDGTMFISFVGTIPAAGGVPPPPTSPPTLLTAISPAGHGQTFALDQIPGLYVSREVGHYVSDSEVVFLVRASRENEPVKQSYSVGNFHGEYTRNAAEQQLYIVNFTREGEYKRAVEIDDTFRIQQLGVFPSGTFLAFGFDTKDHSPKLVMLKEDGTLLKSLEIPKGDAPESMLSPRESPHPLTVSPTQLVTAGRSILLVQNNSVFPILEVNEGGAIRAIHLKLPNDQEIESVIDSDRNLYVIAAKTDERNSNGTIYEVDEENGKALRRFQLIGVRTASDVACIHEGKFLSIDYSAGKVVPLVGSAEPATAK